MSEPENPIDKPIKGRTRFRAAADPADDEGRTREREYDDDEPAPPVVRSRQEEPRKLRFTVFRDMRQQRENAIDEKTLRRLFGDTSIEEDPHDIGIEPPGGHPPWEKPYADRARAVRKARSRDNRDFERER